MSTPTDSTLATLQLRAQQLEAIVRQRPDFAPAVAELGAVLMDLGRRTEALQVYHRAAELQPKDFATQLNFGSLLMDHGIFSSAETHFKKAAALKPEFAGTYNNLGNLHALMGRLDEAINDYRRAVDLDPTHAAIHSNLIFAMNHHPAVTEAQLAEEHARWNTLHARPSPLVAHTNARDPDRVLRVGYISSDFGANQGAFFIEALLRSHRRDRVTVKCYSTLTIADDVTRRMQSTADAWADVATLSAEELATLIRRDGIDVLVDLSGHSRGNRLAAFAQRPAPVQMTYLGYPGAVGASGVTYCVTDVHLDPPGTTRPAHPERLIRLPETYFCYDPKPSAPSVAPTPALAGQPFALGSFNKLQKLNEPTIRIWSGVLRAVPRSRLRLKTNGLTDKGVREMIWSRFASYGIQRQRIEMLGYTPFEQHLPLHNDLDIALDPLIFNGGTTSLHALWMGVPVVTLAGTTPRSRMGVSLLSNLGLTELIAKTEQEYIAKCAALAGDLNRLNTIRLGLRERMQRSPLTDSKRFTAHLEEGYRAAWRDWCAGRAPGDITI